MREQVLDRAAAKRRQRLRCFASFAAHNHGAHGQHHTELRKEPTEPIDSGGAFDYEALAYPVQRQQSLLL